MRGTAGRITVGWLLAAGACPMPAALAGPRAGAAQELPLDSLLRAQRLPVEFSEEAISGPGWRFLVDEAADAQFVVVGESHGVREIPLFTARLFEALHEAYGFDYLALENGPHAAGMYNAPRVRGDPDAAIGLANRYVNALQFRNDQELDLIVAAGRVSGAEEPIWGLDQTWGVLHLLDSLTMLAPHSASRATVAALRAEAAELEAYRPQGERERFITDRLAEADLERLEASFRDVPPARPLLEDLRASWEIYAMRTDGPNIYRSNDRRERYMRTRFVEEYRAAEARGDTLPRVVLKFGQWHALEGVLNWGNVVPLGSFLSEVARSRGRESLAIWTGLVNEPGQFWTLGDYPEYAALGRSGTTDGWWVVDFRPLRPLAAAGRLTDVNDDLRKVIFGFDVGVLIGGGRRATFERVTPGS